MQRFPLRLCERHKDLTAEGAEIAEKGHDSWISNIFFSLPISVFLCVLRALGGESFCLARIKAWWNSLRYPLETARSRQRGVEIHNFSVSPPHRASLFCGLCLPAASAATAEATTREPAAE